MNSCTNCATPNASPSLMMVSQFNGTSIPNGSYSAKTADNDCNVNSSRYSLRTALCESIRYQAKSEQNFRQDLIPRVRNREAALMHPNHWHPWSIPARPIGWGILPHDNHAHILRQFRVAQVTIWCFERPRRVSDEAIWKAWKGLST